MGCFSKHVTLGCISDRKSSTLAEWFEAEVIQRRGVPIMVQSDNGSEWGRNFMDLLHMYNIASRKISPRHSKSNGMAERMVRTVKTYLRSYLRTFPAMEYDNAIGAIAMVINALHSTTLGESPFFIENGVEFRLPILTGL